jgi:glutamine amidotransferase
VSGATPIDGTRLAVVDYGMGNRRSVEKALEHVGVQAEVTSDPERIASADGLVLCGVGAFPAGMQALRETGLGDLVRGLAGEGMPLLGVCLGMQLLFEHSDERGGDDGLGLLAGNVRALTAPAGFKLPHIGWNLVRWTDNPSPVRGALADATAFYHVHSFVAHPDDSSDVLATAEYGDRFVTAVSRGNVHGVQFHPEKSSADGLRVLRAFAETCPTRCPT